MSGGASWQLGDAMRAVELAIVLESLSQTLKRGDGRKLPVVCAEVHEQSGPTDKAAQGGLWWHWDTDQQKALVDLKAALTKRPVLPYPDFTRPLTLVTGGSQEGLMTTLNQNQEEGDQLVAYASKAKSAVVATYNITRLDCAAVIWVNLLRLYLYERKFRLVTDHAALKWLLTSKDLTI
ncbi:RNase H-like domain found in reverse transcriptase [Phytophthora infestans]|uniref:RNase H-like domain found in reverse transcriptase n=1 Tax=Phytophthora infestans TaxID=4787 RepID=A0A833SWS2_PHYIN|nr:RNase H-like domain found in reverse transcriptase [Phytophthora infestans]